MRFTNVSSTSTCPKSGFSVASSVRLELTPYFKSAPTPGSYEAVRSKGFPGSFGVRYVPRATAYGRSSSGFDEPTRRTPTRSAKRDTRPFSFLPMNGNRACSCLRSIQRSKCAPHTWSWAFENRSWERGMRISAVHPRESTDVAASQTGSHDASWKSPSSPISTSFFTAAAFTMNSNAVRRSW